MSSAGASSPIFHAEWFSCDSGYYRLFEPEHSDFTVAFFYPDILGDFWVFECVNCSDDFRPDVIFLDGPLAGDIMANGQVFHHGGPQAAQHSYPLDITVLTDTDDDLPF